VAEFAVKAQFVLKILRRWSLAIEREQVPMYEEYEPLLTFTTEQKAQLRAIDQKLVELTETLSNSINLPEQKMLMASMSELADARACVMDLSDREISILNEHTEWDVQMIFDVWLERALSPLEHVDSLDIRSFVRMLKGKIRRFSYHAMFRNEP
jgi:hypothetical protein